jgi:hypothetical protein
MDILWFFHRRLQLVSTLYDDATAPFRETMRKIEDGEEPFVDRRDPESQDVTEPAFLQEFLETSEAVELIGNWCLIMVHASLQAFLKEYVAELARTHGHNVAEVRSSLDAIRAKNWFERYRLFFLQQLGIDWENSPVKLTDLEQINLTRDDLIHNVEVTTTYVYRAKKHAERFPKSLFTDEMWEALGIGSKIKVGRDELTRALQIVDTFCMWLEDLRVRRGNKKAPPV